jgi:hypothetical protein
MRNITLTALAALTLLAAPALAREPDPSDKPEKPITDKEPSAKDVIATPATDLNIKKDEIPPLLVAAEERPYTLRGIGSCQQIAAAIGELDGVLGDDIDLPQGDSRRVSPGRMAQSVVGSFIPFRGVIREISGANEHDRLLRTAILAGVARRGFLKGTGQARGCRYPARSATLEVWNQREATLDSRGAPPIEQRQPVNAPPPPPRASRDTESGVHFVSQPVVQRTD